MDVTLISQDYPPFIYGGIGTFSHDLAEALSRKGINVNVITGIPKSLKYKVDFAVQRTVENGVNVFRLPYPCVPPRHSVFQLWNFKKISKIIQNINVDIFHAQSGSAFPIFTILRKKAPMIVTFHDSPMMEKISSAQSILRGGSLGDVTTYLLGYPAWRYTYQKELQYSNASVTVSKALKSELLAEMGQKFENKLSFVHNGVNIEALDKEYGKCNDSVEESDETILFAGRLFWRKGALNIISVAYLLQKKHSNFRIIVHGGGPLFKNMKAKISALGLKNIELKGFTAKKELVESMKRSKFVAVPSIYEACPMILLESMCLGKIPLMLNAPFSSELTENGNYGLLADDTKGLIDKLILTKKNVSLNQLSNEIQAFARNTYNINDVASKYLNVYREFC